jgi:hypothetical protein
MMNFPQRVSYHLTYEKLSKHLLCCRMVVASDIWRESLVLTILPLSHWNKDTKKLGMLTGSQGKTVEG